MHSIIKSHPLVIFLKLHKKMLTSLQRNSIIFKTFSMINNINSPLVSQYTPVYGTDEQSHAKPPGTALSWIHVPVLHGLLAQGSAEKLTKRGYIKS